MCLRWVWIKSQIRGPQTSVVTLKWPPMGWRCGGWGPGKGCGWVFAFWPEAVFAAGWPANVRCEAMRTIHNSLICYSNFVAFFYPSKFFQLKCAFSSRYTKAFYMLAPTPVRKVCGSKSEESAKNSGPISSCGWEFAFWPEAVPTAGWPANMRFEAMRTIHNSQNCSSKFLCIFLSLRILQYACSYICAQDILVWRKIYTNE